MLRSDPFTRRIGAAAWNGLVRDLFGAPVHDVDYAFKLARSDLLDCLPLSAHGTMIGAEPVVRALAAGGRVREVIGRDPAGSVGQD